VTNLRMATATMSFETHQLVLIALAGAGWLALARLWKGAMSTTLSASWCWAGVSLTTVVAAELAIAWFAGETAPAWVSHLRYCAAATTFAPVMAVFGAKRPQNRAWQLIVLALLAILIMPSAQALLFRAGEPLALHAARRWFLAILVGMGLLNYVGTRFSVSALLFAAAQVVLLGEALPGVGEHRSAWRPVIGMGLAVAALVQIAWGLPKARSASRPIDRCWFDFRDAFGAVWAWRVLERVNATAAANDWPARLTWRGIAESRNGEEGSRNAESGMRKEWAEGEQEMLRNFKSLLRRFVERNWLEERLGKDGAEVASS
jgi:hypothetical protein